MHTKEHKAVLSLVNEADFAHAGELEAVDLLLRGIEPDPERRLLDIGCARGATADLLRSLGMGRVTGIDADAEHIAWAQAQYPEVEFHCLDIAAGDDACPHSPQLQPFDLMVAFNSFHGMQDHADAFAVLRRLAADGARLLIFDYVDMGGYGPRPLTDADGEGFLPNPLPLRRLADMLEGAGWRLEMQRPLLTEYQYWHRMLVQRLAARRAIVDECLGASVYERVFSRYRAVLAALEEGRLGGALISAVAETE
ncbi:MAG: methyltransferase domain-containing protein [Thiohalocapsa sp.]|nr:methyltransferase domain-containing protein [Thiohalocapsa sp.]MCF7992459.1 methyltransferase domain-containing protein [Thiohalocapsa sp.]